MDLGHTYDRITLVSCYDLLQISAPDIVHPNALVTIYKGITRVQTFVSLRIYYYKDNMMHLNAVDWASI